MLRRSLFASALILFIAGVAAAQNLPPVRVMGTLESVHKGTLVVKSRDGKNVSVALPANVRVIESVKASLADIKAGDFVGSAAVPAGNGRLRAQEVHIFPEDMRGVGEGHRPMGGRANRTMTNGNVPAVRSMTNGTVSGVSGSSRRVLTITYTGGKQEIEVEPETPVTRIVPVGKSRLKPGLTVLIFASRNANGLTARMVSIQKRPRKAVR